MEFILKVVNEEGIVHEIPVPVARYQFQTLMGQQSEEVQKEILLTLDNHIRLSIPVSEEDAEWIGEQK